MPEYLFNRNLVTVGPGIELGGDVPRRIEDTPNLRRASLSDAVAFGGRLVRTALEACPLHGGTQHVFVDTKVSMLMPGWMPAIPGWHTDGVPRDDRGGLRKGRPSMELQERLHAEGKSPTFHLMLIGIPNLTRFLREPVAISLKNGENRRLYQELTELVEKQGMSSNSPQNALVRYAPQQWITWDWWNIHAATPADSRGWRLLIRVTESDIPPADRLQETIFRKQTMVYTPSNYGW